MKFIRRFFRHIREGFAGVFRHFGMSLSSISAVAVTLILIGVFLIITYNMELATKSIENSITISALVSYDSDDEENIERIKKELEAIEKIVSVTYSSKDAEFDYYVNSNADAELKEFYELYREDNPFHDAFIITLDDTSTLSEVRSQIEAVMGIDSVYDGGENTYTLVEILSKIRIFGGAFVIALCALAVYLVYNTIKITIASRRDEIWIMRNVGATNGYIRAPFLVEGILIGFFGALIPIGLIGYGYYYFYQQLDGNLFGAVLLASPFPFIYYLSLILLAIGVGVGFLGSYISVCKYLRIRR